MKATASLTGKTLTKIIEIVETASISTERLSERGLSWLDSHFVRWIKQKSLALGQASSEVLLVSSETGSGASICFAPRR